MKNPITNDVFDSRDLIEYFETITENVISEYNETIEEIYGEEAVYYDIEDIEDADEKILKDLYSFEEYEELKDFIDELSSYCSEFKYGATIIHEDYFEEFVEDYCKGCGYIRNDHPNWIEIDWTATAENMKYDYTEVCYDNENYFILSI